MGAPRGERNGRAKLTEDSVRDLRRTFANGCVSMRDLALDLGVSGHAVWSALTGRTWRHVPSDLLLDEVERAVG